MKVTNAEFIISAASKKQYPMDGLPEVALAGRSNVGKSSFINRLIERKSLARTSSKPGKTQTLNYYKVNNSFYFVDVPGYGYAKVSKQERNKWGRMMEEYFTTREMLKVTLLITDGRHPPTADDIQMYKYLNYLQIPTIVVATKVDKISNNKQSKHIKQSKAAFGLTNKESFVRFSAVKGIGKEDAWSLLLPFVQP